MQLHAHELQIGLLLRQLHNILLEHFLFFCSSSRMSLSRCASIKLLLFSALSVLFCTCNISSMQCMCMILTSKCLGVFFVESHHGAIFFQNFLTWYDMCIKYDSCHCSPITGSHNAVPRREEKRNLFWLRYGRPLFSQFCSAQVAKQYGRPLLWLLPRLGSSPICFFADLKLPAALKSTQ